ncbi:hypothetical protein KM868_09790 [Micrococcus luteus]|uniref:Uncharacterized protein n=1 Tax=Paenibacillus odorifer TaxID=189426 RepID=A0A1R0XKN9_9BACL|nr:hypothetical protein [Paenibacillus odorifer]MBU8763786.1 hypothetical protein [Micrococcus luteus]OMD35654.1 hypothetical protein BSK52_26505 [Paenibacillus odorifer]
MEEKLLKLMQKEETLLRKRSKIEEELKKVTTQIKDLEHQMKVRDIEETIVVLSGHGINLKDIIKEIQAGNFNHLKNTGALENKVTSIENKELENLKL